MEFEELIERKRARAWNDPQLLEAMVELTYGCNLRCAHCYNPTHEARAELTTRQARRLLEELAEAGCLWVGFTGGEILTRPDAMEIMGYAKRLGLVITLVTNATRIDSARADQIRDLDPYDVEISLYGATARTYESVTRVPGSFARFARGVDLLAARKLNLLIKPVMMTLNVHELDAMIAFAQARGLRCRVSTEIHPRVNGDPAPLAYRLPPEQAFEIWRQLSGEKGFQTGSECGRAGTLFDCACGKSRAAITPHGKMNLCFSIHHPLYDAVAGSVRAGWKTLVDEVASSRPGASYECGGCSLAALCTRGTMDGWLEQRRFDGPCISYFRAIAERKANFLESAVL